MIEKAPYPDHPNRCQSVNSQGQCRNLGVRLSDGNYTGNCQAHGGAKQADVNKKQSLKNYRLDKFRFRQQVERLGNSDEVKSLRDEIGILRMILEQRLESIESDVDLMIQSSAISDLVLKIDKLVSSCHKLEGSMGQLLDKQRILSFAQELITIVSEHCTEEQTNKVAEALLEKLNDS